MERPETSTDELLAKARQDDQSALGRLLQRPRPRLLKRAAGRLLGKLARRVEPSEVVQEAMAIGAEKFQMLRGRDKFSFRNWLDKVLDNVANATIRADRRKVLRERSLNDGSSLDFQPADGRTPLPDRLEQREDAEWAWRAIAELDDDDRRLLEARYLHGVDEKTAAALIGEAERALSEATERRP